MSLEAAKTWLSSHDEAIPAFDRFHDRVIELLNQDVAPLSDIADVIMLDPGMSTLLLQSVNAKLKKSNRPGIETVHTAMGHLGKPAIATLLSRHKKLSDACTHKAALNTYRQLLCQGYHALAQLDTFANMQGIKTADNMRAAILLYNLGELQICLFDPDSYQQFRNQLKVDVKDKDPAMDTFGFNFIQLGKLLAQKWVLPELVAESFESSNNTGRKSRLIQLAAEIANQAEIGWYQPSMISAQKHCADYLNIGLEEARQSVQNTAILAARSSPIDEVFSAAARLILLPDVKPVAKPKPAAPAAKKVTRKVSLTEQIVALLKSSKANQSNILSLLLRGLQNDVNFSCVVLMLLSSDKSRLITKIGKGLEDDSAFNKLQIEVAHSGIFKSLLLKPQALCIDASNFKKYETVLPGKFKATCLCDNFVLMSVFIGNKPIGLVYCDRQHTKNPVDNASYREFKSSVMMASKALTYLVKNKTVATT